MRPDLRQTALSRARLYFVCDALDGGPLLERTLDHALSGGVDVVQLRDKRDQVDLGSAASTFRRYADRHSALFVINDDPALARRAGADGVHVGQGDGPVAAARDVLGDGGLVGLSTHAPAQLDDAEQAEGPARPDYVSIGPVWETPTKPGRPATGLEYVRHAADRATLPWFAIGGIDADNVAAVAEAGASRVVVVRAIRDAPDPARTAADLKLPLITEQGVERE